ncbi:MAG: hypothetical protein K2O18_02740 [Oscillospiraceae bacterium]|nr:hypothetical protein [Oscillospiraceae bacterium]
MTLVERIKAIKSIRDVLMTADAITCDADFCEPVLYADSTLYHFPSGYSVKVDFNKLATAIYNAGYRTKEDWRKTAKEEHQQ